MASTIATVLLTLSFIAAVLQFFIRPSGRMKEAYLLMLLSCLCLALEGVLSFISFMIAADYLRMIGSAIYSAIWVWACLFYVKKLGE